MSVKIICHRGWWTTKEEQNTLSAFKRAFDAGLGVELDVRDFCGGLIVSHDPPNYSIDKNGKVWPPTPYFREVLDLLGNRDNIFAVNVKSCGLAPWFAKLKAPKNWFFFDVAVSDEDDYSSHGLPLYLRGNLDCNPAIMVSPEVFGNFDHRLAWKSYRDDFDVGKKVYLITDLVQEAMEFFK